MWPDPKRSLGRLYDAYQRHQRKRAIKLLTTIDPQVLEALGERALFKALRRAAKRVPAYRRLLQQRGVDLSKVTDMQSFRELVPILTKEEVFPRHDIQSLCVDGNLDGMKGPMSSSGFSGQFSFGINTKGNANKAEASIDTALDYMIDISGRRTFLINCVPMGVKIPTSLPVADTSVRADMALAIYKKFSSKFDQTVLVSDPHFLKKLLEDGLDEGIDWKRERVHLISGEDWFPESLRDYLCGILGTQWAAPSRGIMAATMGIAELDLNLFHESVASIRIRRAAERDPRLRQALFGDGVETTPLLFHYYPHRTHVEAIGDDAGPKELVFSMLSESLVIPLIRYNSRDSGQVLSRKFVCRVLEQCGYGDLRPDLQLPLVAVGGRKGRSAQAAGVSLSPELARSLLYGDMEVARQVTGNFVVRNQGDRLEMDVQLREGLPGSEQLHARLKQAFSGVAHTDVRARPYQQFVHGMKLDYETKFSHTDRSV